MRIAYIYKITSPTNKIYIGSTFNIIQRKRMYFSCCAYKQIRLNNSLKKYGFHNHIFEIISECNQNERDKFENYYGNLYNVLSKNGLNCRLPKHKDYQAMSDETKEKISKSNIGKGGWKHSIEAKLKISKAGIGRIVNKETKDKISFAHKGRKHNNKSIENISNAHKKIILNIESGIYYFGVKEVSFLFSKNTNNLYRKLCGQRKNDTQFIYV
jgi:group I intron endonuclease